MNTKIKANKRRGLIEAKIPITHNYKLHDLYRMRDMQGVLPHIGRLYRQRIQGDPSIVQAGFHVCEWYHMRQRMR